MYSNLKLAIWRSGLRQNRLARELNLDETVLSKIINGYRRPSPEVRALLARFFEKPESWLFEPDPERRGESLQHQRTGTGERECR